MIEVLLVIRGGVDVQLKEKIVEIIDDLNLQDQIFLTDITKSHAIDLVTTDIGTVLPLVKRIQGPFNLTLLNGNYMANNAGKYVVVLGKVGDNAIQRAVQAQVKGLF